MAAEGLEPVRLVEEARVVVAKVVDWTGSEAVTRAVVA